LFIKSTWVECNGDVTNLKQNAKEIKNAGKKNNA
jgi:hypothetical protein